MNHQLTTASTYKELCDYFDRSIRQCINTGCKFSTASVTKSGKNFISFRKNYCYWQYNNDKCCRRMATPNKCLDLDDTSCLFKLEGWAVYRLLFGYFFREDASFYWRRSHFW